MVTGTDGSTQRALDENPIWVEPIGIDVDCHVRDHPKAVLNLYPQGSFDVHRRIDEIIGKIIGTSIKDIAILINQRIIRGDQLSPCFEKDEIYTGTRGRRRVKGYGIVLIDQGIRTLDKDFFPVDPSYEIV
jgi:hypothetical protein